jgi:molybdopterin-biosynthesis enzyme MoeA-like protein
MSDDNTASTIAEALERAVALHDEALRQVEQLLRDDDLLEVNDDLETELLG